MHFGDYKTPGTQPNRLFALLGDMRPHDAFELATELRSTCFSTVVSELRKGLDADGSDLCVLPARSVVCGDGKRRRFYQLAPRRVAVDLELFLGERVAA